MLCSLVFASCAYEEICNPNFTLMSDKKDEMYGFVNILAGLCAGEGTLLADPEAVHALECQLALLAPDLAAAADTLRVLVLPNLAGLAPALVSAISVRSANHTQRNK